MVGVYSSLISFTCDFIKIKNGVGSFPHSMSKLMFSFNFHCSFVIFKINFIFAKYKQFLYFLILLSICCNKISLRFSFTSDFAYFPSFVIKKKKKLQHITYYFLIYLTFYFTPQPNKKWTNSSR